MISVLWEPWYLGFRVVLSFKIMKKIYLDYAASTPVRGEVLKAMLPYFSEKYGNPGSLHSFGQEAMGAVDGAREALARSLGAEFREIVFTGSATEANNLVLRGAVGAARLDKFLKPKVIVSAIEHESVLDTAHELERDGVEVVVLPVDRKGIVDLKKLEEELDERTILVSVMYVNNEIGTIEPIKKISDIVKGFRERKASPNALAKAKTWASPRRQPEQEYSANYPLLHTDAAQAFMYLDCDVGKLGVDLMTLSGQKVYGPKGIGALYVNSKLEIRNFKFLSPQVTGGGQEFNLRSGTENVSSIAGFGCAAELAAVSRRRNAKYVEGAKDYFWKKLKAVYKRAEINGSVGAPHIVNVYFPSEYTGDFLVRLDQVGIAASAGSACSARSFTPSHVLGALGFPEERVRGSVRFSFGLTTTRKEIDETIRRIKNLL
jgi:cysteine desulfurase